MKEKLTGLTHTHSENSLKDSAAKVADIVNRAGELGAKGVVLTDHGTLTGIEDFKRAVAKYNKSHESKMKCIPGVEAYVEGPDNRQHLILIAKDYEGYKAISRAVTASNYNLDAQGFPMMTKDILYAHFGPGTLGHGRVIATSACVGGVLASILNHNYFVEKAVEKLQKRQSKLSNPNEPEFVKKKKTLEDGKARIAWLSERVKALDPIAKKPYTKKEKAVEKFKGYPDYEQLKAQLDAEKAETEAAKKEVEACRKEKKKISDEIRPLREECASKEGSHERWREVQKAIEETQKKITPDDILYELALDAGDEYRLLFGQDNFYIELQNHRIPGEIKIMPLLAKLSYDLHIPVVAANDSHIVSNSLEELKSRQLVRSLRFNTWEEIEESDKELYIKTDEELAAILGEILPEDVITQAIENIGKIIDECDVVFPSGESHYPVFDVPEGAPARLRALALKGIEWRYPDRKGWTKMHEERMEYELEIIEKLGYCDYLCIVEDFLRYGRLVGKLDLKHPDPRFLADPYNFELLEELTKNSVGLGIGPGRGSGVGSLVNYLIGITGIDPIKHNLYFERFLNVERVSPPDIDSDIASEIRDRVIDYIKYKYGSEAVCCIMTKGTLQAKAAIRACARLLGSQRYDDTSYFLDMGDKICKALPDELDIKLESCYVELSEKFADDEAAMEIIHNALLIEGTFVNVGMHAAGVIIADNGDVKEYVPLCYVAGKQQFATQCDKVQAEQLGLLKMDALGLKNLDIITNTLRYIHQRYGIEIDIERIPFEDEVFKNIFANGNTDAVFQFESLGMKMLLIRFKPTSIEDLVTLNAAYRPGPIQFIDGIINTKNGALAPEYIVPEMEEILGVTYGFPIFQEQLMSIFNKCAGFSLGEADIIRRAMSKKHVEEFVVYKNKFIEGLLAKGGKLEEIEAFWEKLLKFSQYAFNRSHACAYSYVAYYTAWLKYHYPQEYMCAVLNRTALDKMGQVIQNCRDMNIAILPPDINRSGSEFSLCDEGILYGLNSIKSVSTQTEDYISERRANGRFTSLENFVSRTHPKKSDAEAFIASGAFDAFCDNRLAMLEARKEYSSLVDKIKVQEDALAEATDPEKIEALRDKLDTLYEQYSRIRIDEDIPENTSVRLSQEKDYLGAFISASPLDYYETPSIKDLIPICEIEDQTTNRVHVYGVIKDLRIVKRKKDGREMAFFTLEDRTASVPVACFVGVYETYADAIKEDAVVSVRGNSQITKDEDENGEEKVVSIELVGSEISPLRKRRSRIVIHTKNVIEWTEKIYPAIQDYFCEDGAPLVVCEEMTGKLRTCPHKIDESILQNTLGIKVKTS